MMKRYKKQDYLAIAGLLRQVNTALAKTGWNDPDIAAILIDCQNAAIQLGTCLEQQGEEGIRLTHILEDYCENLYQMGEALKTDSDAGTCAELSEAIEEQLKLLETGIQEKLRDKKEIVFLPYKAAMWDSLESVWMAADQDPDCDAYVVPIPYYERNSDQSFGKYHYEGGEYPEYVPIINYEEFDLDEHHPDAIYIHNPYDEYNTATSVEPAFYSRKLKKYTDCLVYIPYYSTSGGMAEGQALCSAYLHADYIIMQAEIYRKYFDSALPQEKLVPLGSPKFDRVIRLCNNPPEPPAEWKKKMEGRKVYFYNTSIGGMLADTKSFLLKMEYVFRTFQGRKDACIVWRPHPLLETTFDSLRKNFRPAYDKLKSFFIENEIGIYDDTPDITETIALSDAYIGDSGTSVTSLFGIAGKPLFILNNYIHSVPEEDDWRGAILWGSLPIGFCTVFTGCDKWIVTQGNKLYYSPGDDYHYEYCCELSEYAGGGYYLRAIELGTKVYVCPQNAQDILVVEEKEVVKRIPLNHVLERAGAFINAWSYGNYLFLIPFRYPAIVRYDVQKDELRYITYSKEIFVNNVDGEWCVGGSCIWKGKLLLASSIDDRVIMMDMQSGKEQIKAVGSEQFKGCMWLQSEPDSDAVWMLPYTGTTILRWNPETGERQEYSGVPEGFVCTNRPHGYSCMDKPFSGAVFSRRFVYLFPYWGNQFLRIDKESGSIETWNPSFEMPQTDKNGYYFSWGRGAVICHTDTLGKWTYRYFSTPDRRLYDMNLETEELKEINVEFDRNELKRHEPGFCENSDWMQYACIENAFNSLENFLDGAVSGNLFERDRQIRAYGQIAANCDGTSGEKIHRFICVH